MNNKALGIAIQIALDAERRHWNAYIVGGFVRDKILGIQSKDIDIEMFGPASYAELERFASKFGAVNEAGKSFNVLKIHIPGEDPIDLSLPRRDIKTGRGYTEFMTIPDGSMTLREASERRDYTFNALFLNPLSNRIIDFHNGIGHIITRQLRHVGAKFAEDPLRVLRGMQFCGRFDLTADDDTVSLCRSLFDEYDALSVDRVYIEWEKWCTKSIKPSRGLVFLNRTGWIKHYPALSALLRLPQDPRHHKEGSAWEHTKQCVDRAATMSHPDDLLYVMFAALLHDTGKPLTTEIHEDGRITSYGHDRVGADIALDFLKSINAPERVKHIVCNLVREHMVFTAHSLPSVRTVRRLAKRLFPATIRQFIALVYCDLTSRGSLRRDVSPLHTVEEIARSEQCMEKPVEPLVKGRHLIELGMKPSKQFTPILASTYQAQINGEFSDLESGIAYASNLIKEE